MKFLKTDLEGKVRNLPHFKSEALLPVFEAVVNSIQAIEERGKISKGTIDVRIVRDAQQTLSEITEPGVTGFVITDNGIGFNDDNFESFQTSESSYKHAIGGKGVGRFASGPARSLGFGVAVFRPGGACRILMAVSYDLFGE